MIMVKAKIKDSRDVEWVEEFSVSSIETAEQEIKEIIEHFNATLRPYEYPRQFVELVFDYDDELLKSYLRKVLLLLGREARNAYGSVKVKKNLRKWRKQINSFLGLKKPKKNSYLKLLRVIEEFPAEYIDERALNFLRSEVTFREGER